MGSSAKPQDLFAADSDVAALVYRPGSDPDGVLGVPVLIAVPEALFADWLHFSGGLTIRLDCRRISLDRWWTSLSRPPLPHFQPHTVCAQMK